MSQKLGQSSTYRVKLAVSDGNLAGDMASNNRPICDLSGGPFSDVKKSDGLEKKMSISSNETGRVLDL